MFYRIFPIRPEAHVFQVQCRIEHPNAGGQRVSLPAWIPGSYMIRDFSKNILELSAISEGRSLCVKRIDKSTWEIEECAGPIDLTYEVYAWDLSVRSAHLDSTHAYFNGTSVFLKVEGQEFEPCTVDITPPDGEAYDDWRVATTLGRVDAELYGFGLYSAFDYDDLIDHPVEMANFSLATFDVAGVPHDIVLSGRHDADMDRLCSDLKPICEQHVAMFGELPAMERYLFMTMVVGDGYGGLEHRSSTSLMCSRSDLPVKNQQEVSEGYQQYLGLCSHEYFHTWNVKRIKPLAYLPYDLSTEAYTRQLWAFEGITSYYDDLGLVRSGRIEPQRYLNALAKTITRVLRGRGRFKQSVADSSFDAWTKFYRQDENAPNAIVSYYTKGSLIALALDLTIREFTKGECSLDDVMRRLWCDYGKPLVGVPEGRIEVIASEIAQRDLSHFFDAYLYGHEDPDLEKMLKNVGVLWRLRAAESASDKGGKVLDKMDADLAMRADLGIKTVQDNGNVKLANVFDEGAAQLAGLSAGDVLVAINGLKVTVSNFEPMLSRFAVGANIEIYAFRRDELMSFDVVLKSAPLDTCDLILDAQASAVVLAARNAWLECNNH